ncbi:MAG: YbjN domain-containing protein [Selenomonadaceae bacterium]|nr:YbjN domain-containing protein [Selenomonadaceae bacterium]
MDENFEKKRDTTAEVIAAVENFFTRDNVKYRPFDERNVAKATYSIDTKFRHIDVFFHAYSDKLVLHMILPLSADEEERAKVAEFILRANYGLKVGGFDFDFNDGEISYRTSIYCGSDEFVAPTYEQIDFALVIGMIMVERYGDALVKVMFGVLEPDDAIESVESDD